MSSSEDARFYHAVSVVCEDQDGCKPEFIDQPFKFSVVCQSSSSVLFRLSASITDSSSIKTTVYLQITPDHIDSLQNTTCDTSNTNEQSPPCLEYVRRRLGGKHLVTRLLFQLHSGLHPQLIVPTGFAFDEAADGPARHDFRSATSIATASRFSLYIPHDELPMAKFQIFARAVRRFPSLTAAQRQAYERMVDLRRLYSGKGGIVFTPTEDETAVLLQHEERNKSTTPAPTESTESCASTVPFDTVPRLEPPPQYNESVGERQQARVASRAAAAFVKSPSGNDALPEYGDTERQHQRLQTSKRVLQCGSEDFDLHPSSKRAQLNHSFSIIHTTAGNAQSLEAQSQLRVANPEYSLSRLALLLEEQQQKIQQLQEDVDELRRRNKELEGRHDEIEQDCCAIEHRRTENEETIESLLIHTGELDEECEKLGKQMPDMCDEVEDWVKDNMGDLMKEHMNQWLEENMTDTIKDYINDRVKAQIGQIKAKMRKALQE